MNKKFDKALFQSFREDPKGTFEKLGIKASDSELNSMKSFSNFEDFKAFVSKSRFGQFFEF